MTLDHVAIAVRSVEQAADRLCPLLGYARRTAKVANTHHRVNVLFLSRPGSLDIKLIEPADADSPLTDFVRKGGGLHHLCFKVSNVAEAIADMQKEGVRVLSQPAPGEAFEDHLIAFCYLGFGVNAEFIDTVVRRSEIAQKLE